MTYIPHQCPTCLSSNREPFQRGGVVRRFPGGVKILDRLWETIVWHTVTCSDCGQVYRLRELKDEIVRG